MGEFTKWLESNHPDYFDNGSFSYNDGREFSVKNIIKNLERIRHPIRRVNIRRLIPDQFNGNTVAVEPTGSDDWVARANRAELKYPILVIKKPGGGIWIGDGNHRLWKAYKSGQRYINAYVVDEDKLPELNK